MCKIFSKYFFKVITGISVVFAIGIIGMTYYFWSKPPELDAIAKTLQSLSILFVGYGVCFTIYQFFTQKSDLATERKADKTFQQKVEAFRLVEKWDSSIILKARDYSREIKKARPKISDKKLIKDIKNDLVKAASIAVLCNYAEHIVKKNILII